MPHEIKILQNSQLKESRNNVIEAINFLERISTSFNDAC